MCGNLRVLRNLGKTEAMTHSFCAMLLAVGSNPSEGNFFSNFDVIDIIKRMLDIIQQNFA